MYTPFQSHVIIVYFRILEEDISKFQTCISLRLQVASHLDVHDKYATHPNSIKSYLSTGAVSVGFHRLCE